MLRYFKVVNLLGKSRMIFICNVHVDVCVNTVLCNVYISKELANSGSVPISSDTDTIPCATGT